MAKHSVILVVLLLSSLFVQSSFAYEDVDHSGLWYLQMNNQMRTVGEEQVVNYKVPRTLINDTLYVIYSGFGTNDYEMRIGDNFITAYKGQVDNAEYLDRICAVLRRDKGNPEIVPSVDQTYYVNKSVVVSDGSWQQYCWDMDEMQLSQGTHYFGIKCMNCGGGNKFKFQTDQDPTQYYYYNNGWISSGESYNLWAETQWYNVSVVDDAVLNLELENGTVVQQLESFNSNESYKGLGKVFVDSVGEYFFRLRNSVGSLMAELPFWVVIPTEKSVLDSFNIVAEGVRSAEINSTVEESWSYFNPFNVSFENVNCSIYKLDNNFTKSLVSVTLFNYSFTVVEGNEGVFRVRWFADSSTINEGDNYETRCIVNATSYNRTFTLPEFSQYVHIVREKSLWEKIVLMFDKILGIEQKVNETYNLQNKTYLLTQEINRTVHNISVSVSVNATDIYEGLLRVVVPDVFDDGSGSGYVVAFLDEGSLHVAGANCYVDVFENGVLDGTYVLADKGDGVYGDSVVVSVGDTVRVSCDVDGKTVDDAVVVKSLQNVMMQMIS